MMLDRVTADEVARASQRLLVQHYEQCNVCQVYGRCGTWRHLLTDLLAKVVEQSRMDAEDRTDLPLRSVLT